MISVLKGSSGDSLAAVTLIVSKGIAETTTAHYFFILGPEAITTLQLPLILPFSRKTLWLC